MSIIKKLTLFVLIIGAFVAFGYFAVPTGNVYSANGLNQACNDPQVKNNPYCVDKEKPVEETSLITTIKKITIFVAALSGAIAVIVIIYGGYRYVVSGGNEQKVATAKNTVLYGVVGLVIIAVAQTIVYFVLNMVT